MSNKILGLLAGTALALLIAGELVSLYGSYKSRLVAADLPWADDTAPGEDNNLNATVDSEPVEDKS